MKQQCIECGFYYNNCECDYFQTRPTKTKSKSKAKVKVKLKQQLKYSNYLDDDYDYGDLIDE